MREMPNLIVALVVLLVVTQGCLQPGKVAGTAWKTVAEDDMTAAQTVQRDKALAARDAMFTSLKRRLMEVVGSDGPVAAIPVCSKEAPQIAERVSREHGLKIGRTSFRLRNASNAPPPWATRLVEDRVSRPTYLTHEGKLAALLPIRLQGQCVVCHGPADRIPAPIKAALAEYYPQDRATGFREGDLRGWFCVEMPASPES